MTTLDVQTDRQLIRTTGKSVRYALLSFTAPESTRVSARAPINVSFVIDRSGSMGGSKIELARQAVIQAVRMLRSADRFSVVSYDHEIDVLVPSTLATGEAVQNAIRQVESLEARGNTDLGGGWLKGCEQVATHLDGDRRGLCLLLSDGLANHGITDRDELARHSEELHGRGIRTSCFGIGDDYDERLLEGLATASHGNFYYVQTPVQISDFLTSELGEALETVAREVVVTVGATEGTRVSTLNRFATRKNADGNTEISLGDLTSRQDVSVVVRLEFPAGQEGQTVSATFGVSDAAVVLGGPETDRIWTFAGHADNDSQRRNVAVDRAVARLYAAEAKKQALEMNRARDFEEARERLERTARRIKTYAGRDPELRAIVDELREDGERYAGAMSSARMKGEHFAYLNVSRMRDFEGKARRQ